MAIVDLATVTATCVDVNIHTNVSIECIAFLDFLINADVFVRCSADFGFNAVLFQTLNAILADG